MLPELKRCIERSGLTASRVCIIAFERSLLLDSKRVLPEVEHAWVIDRPSSLSFGEIIESASGGGLDGLDLEASWPIGQEQVARAHGAGLKVYVWTVDDMKKALHLAAAGLDGITTNMPASLHHALNQTS